MIFFKIAEEYEILLEKRKVLLEDFKSNHAIIHNSLLSTLRIKSLVLQNIVDDNKNLNIISTLYNLSNDIVIYYFLSEDALHDRIAISIDQLRFMIDKLPLSTANQVEDFIAHTQIIFDKKFQEKNIFTELMSLTTNQHLSKVLESYEEFYNYTKEKYSVYRILLYIISVVLFSYLLCVLYKIKIQTKLLTISNMQLEGEVEKRKCVEEKLQDVNDGLESRVAERTQELECSNAQLRFEILERQATQATLSASETRYRTLIEGSLQGISIVSLEGERLFANRKLLEILGYDNLDAYIRSDPYRNIARHEHKRLRDYRVAVIRGEASPNFYEYEGCLCDGTPIWLERLVTTITWEGETALFSSLIDITERKHAEAERVRLQRELLDVSRQAGMAEVATGVLHNVGNVLNSVTTAAALALERLHQSQVSELVKAVALIDAHADDLGAFITSDPQGQHLPMFLRHLSQHLLNECEVTIEHLQAVNDKVEHIKEIVTLQQSYATAVGVIEPLALATLMDDALKTHDDTFDKHKVEMVREYGELPLVLTDRHKVLQILINLLSNAKHALLVAARAERLLTVRVGAVEANQVYLEVEDNGIGIGASELTQIFQHGYTTKASGHGFGLHSSALAAQELGGRLSVHSDGLGQGARFRLELPMKEAVSCLE